jgi:hypothetical protein
VLIECDVDASFLFQVDTLTHHSRSLPFTRLESRNQSLAKALWQGAILRRNEILAKPYRFRGCRDPVYFVDSSRAHSATLLEIDVALINAPSKLLQPFKGSDSHLPPTVAQRTTKLGSLLLAARRLVTQTTMPLR